jgi:hypothetical protein
VDGCEAEFAIPEGYGIMETGWFHLGQPETWGAEVHQDQITLAMLQNLRKALGYA